MHFGDLRELDRPIFLIFRPDNSVAMSPTSDHLARLMEDLTCRSRSGPNGMALTVTIERHISAQARLTSSRTSVAVMTAA